MYTAFSIYSPLLLLLLSVPVALPQTLLLGTDRGVQTLTVSNGVTDTLDTRQTSAVDFRYDAEELYFISGNNVFYSYYSKYNGGRGEPIPTVRSADSMSDLVIDWERYRLYYSCEHTSAIYESALLGSIPRQIFSGVQNVRNIAIDPYDRLLFVITDHSLVSFALDSHQTFQYHFNSPRLTKVVKMAVDHHERQIYVVGYDEDNPQWSLVRTDYAHMSSSLVFRGPELAGAKSLDVFHGQVVWVTPGEDWYILHSCTMTPDCTNETLHVIWQSVEPILDVRFYDPLVQTPNNSLACSRLNCSHSCTEVSLYKVSCSCPQGLVAEEDGTICREPTYLEELSILWSESVEGLWEGMSEACLQWLRSQTYGLVLFVYVCCALMMMLLLCGLCLLMCMRPSPKSKKTIEMSSDESYHLKERNDQRSRRLQVVDEKEE